MAEETTLPEDPVEVLEPGSQNRDVTLGTGELEWKLTQRPLNFFQKMELFSVLGSALDKAMQGPDGLSLNALLDMPEHDLSGDLSAQDFADADTFIKAIAKLTMYAPDLLLDIYCIVLGVPRGRRDLAKGLMQMPVEEGGLNDEDGMAILETFFEQNWDVLRDFFGQRILPLYQKVTGQVRESRPSKPSSRTRRSTPKASKSS